MGRTERVADEASAGQPPQKRSTLGSFKKGSTSGLGSSFKSGPFSFKKARRKSLSEQVDGAFSQKGNVQRRSSTDRGTEGSGRKLSLSGTDKVRKIAQARILDDFMERVKLSRALSLIAIRKSRMATLFIAVLVVGIITAQVEVALRLELPAGQAATPAIEGLRVSGAALTLVALAAHARFVALNRQIHQATRLRFGWFQWCVYLLEVVVMLAGTPPPMLEATVPNPPRSEPLHIDCLMGVLCFSRIILVVKFGLSCTLVRDPALLAWQYNTAVVRPTFRLKILFQRQPTAILLLATILTWLVCGWVMYVFEYEPNALPDGSNAALWMYLALSWDMMSGLGWGFTYSPTVGGRLASMLASALGVVIAALLTATCCSAFELDSSEVILLNCVVKNQHLRNVSTRAAILIQQGYRRHLRRRRVLAFPSPGQRNLDNMTVALARRRFRGARSEQARSIESVANIKVLQGELQSLREALRSAMSLQSASLERTQDLLLAKISELQIQVATVQGASN